MRLPEKGGRGDEMVPICGSRRKEPDMDGLETGLAPIERLGPTERSLEIFTDIGRRRITRHADLALRCVFSGYLSDGCSCRSTIPAGVVTAAWAREQRVGVCGDRLFHFAWRGEVWLAYGLQNSRVSGVYCPVPSAERDRHCVLEHAA